MTSQLPEPTSVIRPASAAHWEVMPAENDALHGVHTVKRFTDAQSVETVSIHYGRIDAPRGQVLRVGPRTARLLAEVLLAAADWTDEPTQHATRQWQASDPEPDDVTKVRDALFSWLERHPDGWHPAGCPRTKCIGMSWCDMNFPLTEVRDA